MDEFPPGAHTPARPERPGESLRAARERMGLSLAEIAARTRVPLRHLGAIEDDNYAGLPSPTYAAGFARAYARAVGIDEVEIARGVRGELAGVPRTTPDYQPWEATDPARVPSRGVAIVALGLALAVLVLAGLYFGTGLFNRGVGPATPDAMPVTPSAVAAVGPAAAPTPAASQVFVTATDEVWVRIYDAAGKTLHQGTLQPGERFEVPGDAQDPMINVGRPDKINITVNGSQLQGLDLGRTPIKDVRVSAAALTARAAGQPQPAASATPAAAAPRDRRTADVPRPVPPAVSEAGAATPEVATAPSPGNAQ